MNSAPKKLQLLKEWVDLTVQEDRKILDIPLTSSSKKSPFQHKYIAEEIGMTIQTLSRYASYLTPLSNKLKAKGWLLDDVPLFDQNIIRRHRALLLDINSDVVLLKTEGLIVKNNVNIKKINELMGGGTRVTKAYSHAYKYFKDEFERELFELLKENNIYDSSTYKTVAQQRKDLKRRRSHLDDQNDIKNFMKQFEKNSDFKALLSVEYNQTRENEDCTIRYKWAAYEINKSKISKWGDISVNSIKSNCHLFSSLEEKLKIEGILIKGVRGFTLNFINRLRLVLYEFDEKPKLLTNPKLRAGNKISRQSIKKFFPEIVNFNIASVYQTHPKFQEFWCDVFEPRILASMKERKVFDHEAYKTVQERINEVDYEKIELSLEKSSLFDSYRSSDSSTYSNVKSNTLSDELLHLIAITSRAIDSLSQIKCMHTLLFGYFSEQGFALDSHLDEIFSEYSAPKFRTWLEDKVTSQSMGASTAHGYIHTFQRILNSYYDLEDVDKSKPFIKVGGFPSAGRNTDTYKPYPKDHREVIASVIDEAIDKVQTRHLQNEYKKATTGESFFNYPRLGKRIKCVVAEKSTLKNLRWYFDHELDSIPVYRHHFNTLPKDDPRCLFWKAWKNYRKKNIDAFSKITDLYDDWGVARPPNLLEIIPYYLKLLQVTGMNAESVCKLTVDSFIESHPATGRPCIRYFKERSDGNKEMFLDIFTADITWLSKSQSKIVSDVISDLLSLTKSIRKDAGEFSNQLFIYQNDPSVVTNKILSLDGGERGRVSNRVNKSLGQFDGNWKNTLVDKNGELVQITTTRFRPSLVSELVDAGTSIREIQLILGHASIQTTLKYLDGFDFNKIARSKIEEKLNEIYSNALVPKEEDPDLGEVEKEEGEIIFKTPLGGCKNIMNPPDFIKKSTHFKGGACDKFNQCISCDNVILTTSHLPELFALQRDYVQSLSHQRVASTPYGHIIQQNLAILESILGDDSEFSKSELKEAEKLSKYIESSILIDGVAA